MECEHYREWIQAFVDGELSDAQTDVLREHCMRCRSCARYLRDMDALQRATASLGNAPLPEGLHERILTAVRREAAEQQSAPQPVAVQGPALQPAAESKDEAGPKAEVRTFAPAAAPAAAPQEAAEPQTAYRPRPVRSAGRKLFPILAALLAIVILGGTGYTVHTLLKMRGQNMVGSAAGTNAAYVVDEERATTTAAKTAAAATTAAATTVKVQPTTAAATTAAAVTTTAATTAAPAAVERTESLSTVPASASMTKEELAMARDEAAEMIPAEIAPGEEYGFVQVVRTTNVPLDYKEWDAENLTYRGEKVTCCYAVLTAERIQEILDVTDVDSGWFCSDPGVWDALTPDCEMGLLLMMVPQGT